jgi:hypothetical protein
MVIYGTILGRTPTIYGIIIYICTSCIGLFEYDIVLLGIIVSHSLPLQANHLITECPQYIISPVPHQSASQLPKATHN